MKDQRALKTMRSILCSIMIIIVVLTSATPIVSLAEGEETSIIWLSSDNQPAYYCVGLDWITCEAGGVFNATSGVRIPEYDYAMQISNDLIIVIKTDNNTRPRCGYIDITGKEIVPLEYVEVNDFSEGLALVAKDYSHYGFIDKTGKVSIPLIYDDAKPFSEGLACVEVDRKYGYIDKSNKTIIAPEYDHASSFKGGIALVKKDDKYGFINKKGEQITLFEYDEAKLFSEGVAVVKQGKQYGYIDKNGRQVTPIEYDEADSFSGGLARVKKDGKYGFIDRSGQAIIPIIYDAADPFSEGLSFARKGGWNDGKCGYIDQFGKEITSFEYDVPKAGYGWICRSSEGLACIKKDGKYGYIDCTGKMVIATEYDWVHPFSEGLADVKRDGKMGFIDQLGEVIIPFEYDSTYGFEGFVEGLARVKKGKKWGMINKANEIVIPFEYNDSEDFGYIVEWEYDETGDLKHDSNNDVIKRHSPYCWVRKGERYGIFRNPCFTSKMVEYSQANNSILSEEKINERAGLFSDKNNTKIVLDDLDDDRENDLQPTNRNNATLGTTLGTITPFFVIVLALAVMAVAVVSFVNWRRRKKSIETSRIQSKLTQASHNPASELNNTMLTRFCPYCGTQRVSDAQFCMKCGKRLPNLKN